MERKYIDRVLLRQTPERDSYLRAHLGRGLLLFPVLSLIIKAAQPQTL